MSLVGFLMEDFKVVHNVYVCSMELHVHMANLKANRTYQSVCCRSEEGH